MKKKIIILLVLVFTLVLVTSCFSTTGPNQNGGQPNNGIIEDNGTNSDNGMNSGSNETYYCNEGTHLFYDWYTVEEATCTKAGKKERICANCPFTESRTIYALGHDKASYKGTATCTSGGYKDYVACLRWGCDYTTYSETGPLGHSFGKEYENSATCTEPGTAKHNCTRTGCEFTETYNTEALGHDTITHPEKAPTCTEDGWNEYVSCSRCEYTTFESIQGGHSFENGVCKECNSKKSVEYLLSDDGSFYIVVGIGDYTDNYESVAIESTYKGLPVKEIAEYAFGYNCENITSVTIPESIRRIGGYAFAGCQNLKNVFISNLDAWCTIEFENRTSSPLSFAGYLYVNQKLLTSVAISDEIDFIANFAFANYEKLSSVSIPSSIEYIGNYAFYNCSNLSELIIADGVTAIGFSAFEKCANLCSVSIPDSVDAIGSYAFADCTKLQNIRLSNRLEYIPSAMLKGCSALEYLEIPNSVCEIECGALEGCNGLIKISLPFVGASRDAEGYKSHFGYIFGYEYSSSASSFYHYYTKSVDFDSMPNDSSSANGYYLTYKIPEYLMIVSINDMTAIKEQSFINCTYICEIRLGEGIRSIAENAFDCCLYLDSIVLPTTLTTISKNAFNECIMLRFVYFTGENELNWNKISISHTGNSALIESTVFYYSKELPTTEGAFWFYNAYGNIELWPDHIHSMEFFETTKDATCLLGGEDLWMCTVEGCGHTESRTTDALGHNYNSLNICTICNDIKSSDGIKFTLGDDGTYYIVSGIGSCVDSQITIAKTHNLLPIKGVAANAFKDNTNITSVYIYEGIEFIGDYAFSGCTSLTRISIPNSISKVGNHAFPLTSALSEYDNAYYVGNEDNPYLCLVTGKSKDITSCTINDSTKIICPFAFSGYENLNSVSIGKGVISIGEKAFSYCSGLKELYFNAVLMDDLDSSHDIFINTKITGSSLKVIIGKDVVKIPAHLFHTKSVKNEPKISVIEFEDGSNCTHIGEYAFYSCPMLKNISLGKAIVSIGDYAFANCTALKNIYFNAVEAKDFDSSYSVFENAGKNESGIKLTIGKDVVKIPAYLFYEIQKTDAPKITAVEFESESACVAIGASAFANCELIEAVYLSDLIAWCNIAFADMTSNPMHAGANLYLSKTLLSTLIIPDTVTKIKAYTFAGCESITSLSMSDNVTEIDTSAFRNCYSLKDVSFSNAITVIGESAFECCISIVTMDLPDALTEIKKSAFSTCISLTDIKLSNSITKINDLAFWYCDAIKSVYVEDIAAWCSISFASASASPLYYEANLYLNEKIVTKQVIPNTVTEIKDFAFRGCKSLTEITIPNSVTSISGAAFANCSALTTVTIGNYVTSIGDVAFVNCKSLSKINMGSSVSFFGEDAFSGCSALTSITIPATLAAIGNGAFSGCSSLKNVYMSDIAAWCNITLGDTYSTPFAYLGKLYLNDVLLTELVIPNAVTKINYYAFAGCSSITSVKTGNRLTEIGAYAFTYCTSLKSVYISESVTRIDSRAFFNSSSLTSAVFECTSNWSASNEAISSADLSNTSTAATYLSSTYSGLVWKRS